MERKLLLFFVMLFVSIGTWATITTGSTTWCQYNSYAEQENVLTIYVDDPGELATAIAGLDFTDVQILHISARNREASLLELSSEDIAALSSVNVETIEMMRAYVSPVTFTNSNLKRVILPYNWTRAEVKAFGQANSTSANFEACISMNDQDAYESRTDDAALIAYLNKPNTLKDAIMRTWNDTHGYAPLGNTIHQGGGDCSRLKYLTVMGNISARDISSKGTYDENGHYVTNGVPDENSDVYNKNTDGGDYYVAGETPGALTAYTNDLYVLDLKDAYVPNENAADIVFPYSQMGGSNLREIWMPEDSRFNTVPADYLNTSCNVRQICIPGNIKYIKTRSFAGNSGTGRMCYIWTTGPDPLVKYDNGAAFVNGDETTWKYMNNAGEGNVAMTASDYNQFQYGTFTLPAGLELIERFAFSQSTSVSDVYVLNKVAPECHVDAFNCTMYLANNTLQTQYIKDGIVTREAYRNDGSGTEYKFVTILHYPRETTDPNIQRYTDPTREYSIATGERDGNGSTIYYPNHSEMTYAYFQGSFGYLWKGWDDSRNWYDQSLKAGYGEGLPATEPSHKPDNPGAQATANQRWINNVVNADQKADRSFYDVTTGGNNQPGETTAPSGLTPYYENRYSGYNGVLYPQAETEGVTDENGNPVPDKANRWFVGYPIDVIYDYEYDGIWNKEDVYEVTLPDGTKTTNLAILEPGGDIGMIKVKYNDDVLDANGVPTRQIGDDDRRIQSMEPDLLGGFNTTVGYKGFDLTVIGAFQIGGKLISAIHSGNGYLNMLDGRRNNIDVDYWTEENTGAKYPRPNGIRSGDNPKYASTLGYFDAGYLKIRAITLGYNFENIKAVKDFGISRLRLYATIQNPFVLFSPFNNESGLDPETNSWANQNTAVAYSEYSGKHRMPIVGYNTPSTRNFMFGLNVTF